MNTDYSPKDVACSIDNTTVFSQKSCEPFLKWLGSKRKLLSYIDGLLPQASRLVEPFVGSAAVTLGLRERFVTSVLADANPDIPAVFNHLVADTNGFIAHCRSLFVATNNTEAKFKALRAKFNALPPGDAERAALFVWLNKHTFNGLVRYNASGQFNAPYGYYDAPELPEAGMMTAAQALAGTTIQFQDFRMTMAQAVSGLDAIYADPPYIPASPTANFTTYSAKGFSQRDHEDLADLARGCAARGVPVLVSNSDTELTKEIYAGARITELDVRRSVSCKGDGRGKAKELLLLFVADEEAAVTRKAA